MPSSTSAACTIATLARRNESAIGGGFALPSTLRLANPMPYRCLAARS